MVTAIIVLLASITFGVYSGVKNAQSRAKAKAELALLSQALEQYKARFGDYPLIDSGSGGGDSNADAGSKSLIYALSGRLRLVEQNGTVRAEVIDDNLDNTEVERMPKFIDLTKFSYQGPDNSPEALIDPWGNPYVYRYKVDSNPEVWDVFGFHLYSTGPNGEEAEAEISAVIDPSTGVLENDFRDTADAAGIIFAAE